MPTLLSVNNYHYRRGGAETVFLEENRLFKEAGWKVVPFSMHHSSNLESCWEDYFIDTVEFGEKYSLWQKVRMALKIVYSQEAKQKLRSLLRAVPVDICHLHNIYHHISPSILGPLRKQGISTVMTLHDLKLACPAYKMLTHDGVCERCKGGNLYNVLQHKCVKNSSVLSALVMIESSVHRSLKLYLKNVDKFVVPSRFYLKKFVEWGFPEEKFVYIPNFVKTEPLPTERRAGRGLLYFGRLAPEKGVRTLVEAAALAKVELLIAGEGPEEKELRELAKSLGCNVQFLGFLQGKNLRKAILGSRAVVLPSEWYENAPLTLMEAYSLGKPVIGAEIGGIPELIKVDETGFIFESGSVSALSRMLVKVTEMTDVEVLEMGRRGWDWVAREFSPEKYKNRLLSLYSSLGVR